MAERLCRRLRLDDRGRIRCALDRHDRARSNARQPCSSSTSRPTTIILPTWFPRASTRATRAAVRPGASSQRRADRFGRIRQYESGRAFATGLPGFGVPELLHRLGSRAGATNRMVGFQRYWRREDRVVSGRCRQGGRYRRRACGRGTVRLESPGERHQPGIRSNAIGYTSLRWSSQASRPNRASPLQFRSSATTSMSTTRATSTMNTRPRAVGNNRGTGKTPLDPKANLLSVFNSLRR